MTNEIQSSVSFLKNQGESQEDLIYDVIFLFKKVLNSEEKNKTTVLHYIYNELMDAEISDWFKKTSIRELSRHSEFVDWYAEKMTDKHLGTPAYIKTTLSASFNFSQNISMKVIEKNFANLSQDVFKNQVLSPLHNKNSKAIHPRYIDLYAYYISKYVEKKQTITDLQDFSPDVQNHLVDNLVKNKWFDNKLYLSLKSHIYSLESAPANKMLGSIFKYESNIENLKMFEKDLVFIIKNKTIESDAFFKGVNDTREKTDYIFKNLIVNEEDYNKALDNSLSSKGNSSDKKEFNIFLNNVIDAHFSGEKKLTQTQFLIVFKKCYDCGQKERITNIMDQVKVISPVFFNKMKNSLRLANTLNIYDKTLDFSKDEVKKYFLTLLHNYLINDLEKEDKPTRKIKI